MKRLLLMFTLLILSAPAFAKTHSDMFNVPCKTLWPAVKDTLRNSGKYGIIGIDNEEMTASYNIGGYLGGKRTNSLVLNTKGNECELQTQTVYSGLTHNDAGDLKKRVEESLAKLQKAADTPSQPAATEASGTPPASGTPAAKPADPKN